MDLYLSKERINFTKNVLTTTIMQDETMEMIVPDALPDILRIVCADATVLVRGKETDAGRVTISGIAATSVIYCPDGFSGVRRLNVDIPFSISAAESELTAVSKVTANVCAVSADATVINPRKLAVSVGLRAEIACYNDDELLFCTDAEVSDDAGIELLRENRVVRTPVDVREKSFVIADELALTNSSPEIAEILRTRVSLAVEESKIVGNKLIFKGATNVFLLYNPMDGGDPVGAELSSEFSQIMELESISDDCEFDIIMMLTGAYFEIGGTENSENKALSIELHVVAQCVTAEKKSIPYISDAYSTKYQLTQSTDELTLENREYTGKVGSVFRGTLEAQGSVSRVVSLSVNAGIAEAVADGSMTKLTAPLKVTAVYISADGAIMSASGSFEAEATMETRGDCKYFVRAEPSREVYGAASGSSIELRIPVDFSVTQTTPLSAKPVTELSYDEDAPVDLSKKPSLIISCATGADTLWRLAKRHHSTMPLILSANGLDSEEEIAPNQMLIIPKKR